MSSRHIPQNSNLPGMIGAGLEFIISPVLRRNLIKGCLITVIVLVASEYARWTFDNPLRAQEIAMGLEERPYVYRALVPWLAHALTWLGLSPDLALTVLVILSAIGLLYAIKYLLASLRP